MITAYKATYLKDQLEPTKRKGLFCIIEIQLKEQRYPQVMVMNEEGLLLALHAKSITAIKGYRSYSPLSPTQTEFGAGGIEPLKTKGDDGMLEVLAQQMGYKFSILSQAFGTGLLQLSDIK